MRSFLKSISVFGIVSLLTSSISFLLLPVLTKYLSQEDYGILSLFNAMIRFFVILLSVGGSSILMRNLFKVDKEELGSYFNSFYFLTGVNVIISTIVLALWYYFADDFFGIPGWLTISIPIIASIVVFYELIISVMIYKKQEKKYVISSISKFFLELLLTLLLVVVFAYSWQGRIASLVFSIVAVSSFFIYYLKKQGLLKGKIKALKVRELVVFGFPLIAMDFSTTVLNLSDRFFLENLVGLSETGIYSIGYIIGAMVLMGVNVLANVFRPIIYERLSDYRQNKRYLSKISWYYFLMLLGLTLIIIFFINDIVFDYFIESKFSNAREVVLPVGLGFFFWGGYIFYVSYLIFHKKQKAIFWTSLVSILLNLILNYIFILWLGMIGAAYATLITYFTLTSMVYLYFQLNLKKKMI